MSLSLFPWTSIVLLLLSVHVLNAQFFGSPMGRCPGRFERYRVCASTCPDTCDDIRMPNPTKICNLMCRNGCDCMRHFVRLNRNPMSPCVHPRQCGYTYGI